MGFCRGPTNKPLEPLESPGPLEPQPTLGYLTDPTRPNHTHCHSNMNMNMNVGTQDQTPSSTTASTNPTIAP